MNNDNLLWKYAGLTAQFLIGIGLFTFVGLKIDGFLKLKTPLAVWVLPLVLITAIIIKVIIDTSRKK
ncbi:MAG: hypothetical protein WCH52_02885 [Bacteroidota bacterium]